MIKRYLFCAVLFAALLAFGMTTYASPAEYQDTTVVQDSGVVDSGNVLPTSTDVAIAIVQIRDFLSFAIFGVFPLSCAVLYCYLFSKWIYRLIMSAV